MGDEKLTSKHNPISKHYLVDVFGCDESVLNSEKDLYSTLLIAVEEAGSTCLGGMARSFSPQGVTVLLSLAESHASIHTWPELGQALIDYHVCGPRDFSKFMSAIQKRICAKKIDVKEISRGINN